MEGNKFKQAFLDFNRKLGENYKESILTRIIEKQESTEQNSLIFGKISDKIGNYSQSYLNNYNVEGNLQIIIPLEDTLIIDEKGVDKKDSYNLRVNPFNFHHNNRARFPKGENEFELWHSSWEHPEEKYSQSVITSIGRYNIQEYLESLKESTPELVDKMIPLAVYRALDNQGLSKIFEKDITELLRFFIGIDEVKGLKENRVKNELEGILEK
ncbi:hypothetical protein GOV13_03200 [Candidatus Pacearchaeota archaeon]|nr:hypothetical protein [Candidatus Pacearchaeota archaeon]